MTSSETSPSVSVVSNKGKRPYCTLVVASKITDVLVIVHIENLEKIFMHALNLFIIKYRVIVSRFVLGN